MNIFGVDRDPVVAARSLCDVHVTKMVTESAQILCTAASLMRYEGAPYSPYRSDRDKLTNWVMRSRANWDWLVAHGVELHRQHQRRKGTQHRALIAMCWARNLDPYEHEWEAERLTPFADVTWPKLDTSQYPDPSLDLMVEAYREYYIRKEVVWAEKARERALEFIQKGRDRISKGRRPVMTWAPPSVRPSWMPVEVPDWRPTDDEVAEARSVAA